MKNYKKTAVLLVAYNRAKVLDACLKALRRNSPKSLYEIFVVDNGSTEKVRDVCKKNKASYLRLPKNVYVSKALNLGFDHFNITEKFEYVILMGSDVLTDSSLILKLTEFMQKYHDVGVSGPSHYEITSKKLISIGVTVHRITSLLRNFTDKRKPHGMNHFHSLYITRSQIFKQIKGFDHVLFPMIYEEPDMGERILSLGYKIISCPGAKIWHPLDDADEKSTSAQIRAKRLYSNRAKAYLFFRNRIIYMRRHSNLAQFVLFIMIWNPLISLLYLPTIDLKNMTVSLRGTVDGVLYGFSQDRSFIMKQNKKILGI
jgi:GT2 family glycosyltransferase